MVHRFRRSRRWRCKLLRSSVIAGVTGLAGWATPAVAACTQTATTVRCDKADSPYRTRVNAQGNPDMTVTLDDGVAVQTTGTALSVGSSRNISVNASGATITATSSAATPTSARSAVVTNAPGATAITVGSVNATGPSVYGVSANVDRLSTGTGNVRIDAQTVTIGRGSGTGSAGIFGAGAGGDIAVKAGSITNPEGQAIIVYAVGSSGSIEVTGAVTTGSRSIYMLALNASNLGLAANYTAVGDPAQRNTGSITVGSNGSLTSSSGAAATMLVGARGVVTNNGTIQTLVTSGKALEVWYTGATTVNNNGRLIGGIQAGSSLSDTINNAGVLKGAGSAGAIANAVYSDVEFFNNSGLIDMRNGVAGDVFQQYGTRATPTAPGLRGSYVGTGNATVAMEIAFTETGAIADRLLLDGASGQTKINLSVIGNGPASFLTDGIPLVVVDPSANRDVFTLTQPLEIGGLRYSLNYDPIRTAYTLYGAPSAAYLRQIKVPTITQAAWNQTNDMVATQLRGRRDARWNDVEPRGGLWMQLLGGRLKRDERFGRTINNVDVSDVDVGYKQRSYSGQIGFDTAGPEAGEAGVIVGATAGYTEATADFSGSTDRVKVRSANGGAYANVLFGRFHLGATANYTQHWLNDRIGALSLNVEPTGRTIGASLEGGVRLGGESFFAEPSAGISYAVTRVSSIATNGGQIAFDDFTGQQGFASLRVGGRTALRSTEVLWYVGGAAVHEFAGNDLTRMTLRSAALPVENRPQGTLGRATIGLTSGDESRTSLFVEARGSFGSGYSSYDSRAGLRVRF